MMQNRRNVSLTINKANKKKQTNKQTKNTWSQVSRYLTGETHLELLYFKPKLNITFQRVSFHRYKRSELATAVGIEEGLT